MTRLQAPDGSHCNAAQSEAATLLRSFSLKALPDSFYEDPYPTYRLLQEHDPIHQMPDGSLFLTRHRHLEAVYKDTTSFSSDKKVEFTPKYGRGSLLLEHHTTSLVFNDPPLHARVRRLIAGALSPRAIAEVEPALVALVERLLDEMQVQGETDLIESFASAIPVEVIGNLLAIPHEDRGPLRGWSLAILGALEPVLSQEMRERGERAVVEFLAYLRLLVADRRKRPGDPERDVLTRLIQGEASSGKRLSETELLQNCIFILASVAAAMAGAELRTCQVAGSKPLWISSRTPGQRAWKAVSYSLVAPSLRIGWQHMLRPLRAAQSRSRSPNAHLVALEAAQKAAQVSMRKRSIESWQRRRRNLAPPIVGCRASPRWRNTWSPCRRSRGRDTSTRPSSRSCLAYTPRCENWGLRRRIKIVHSYAWTQNSMLFSCSVLSFELKDLRSRSDAL